MAESSARRLRATIYRWSRGLAVLVAPAAIALAACGSSGPSDAPSNVSRTVASLAASSGQGGGSSTKSSGRSSEATPAKGDPTRLVDEWAACVRGHGDVDQPDPIVDAHGVINITMPPLGSRAPPPADAHDVTATCSEYLAAAQRALRAADPVRDPLGMDNQADLLKYVDCMRTSGVPNYPYPTGSTTNFNGTGVDPNSPFVVKVSIKCGNKLGLPLWWSAGWGPPGDVTVRTSILPGADAPGHAAPATSAVSGGAKPGPSVARGLGSDG
jgi:hypothetical protein